MGNVVPTLDTTDAGTQHYPKRKNKQTNKQTNINPNEITIHDRSSSALIVKISQPVSCNIPGTWYEVLLRGYWSRVLLSRSWLK